MIRQLLCGLLMGIIICAFACKEKAPPDPCAVYSEDLNGTFNHIGMDAKMIFTGGREGSFEVAGLEVSDMTCAYTILNCETGNARLLCDGNLEYETSLVVISRDSVRVSGTLYVRQ